MNPTSWVLVGWSVVMTCPPILLTDKLSVFPYNGRPAGRFPITCSSLNRLLRMCPLLSEPKLTFK